MSSFLASGEPVVRPGQAGAVRRDREIRAYRAAVTDVVAQIAGPGGSPRPAAAERILAGRMNEPEFELLFAAMPGGPAAAAERVLREVRTYRPSACSSAGSLTAMIRIALLAQIDALWWGHLTAYETDSDVLTAAELLDLDVLRRDGLLLFRYRRQTSTLVGRAVRSAERLAVPGRTPRTAGLRFACARAELIVTLNQVAADLADQTPAGTPPLWVTSLARSSQHQRHLRSLGYAALQPSAHCVGYAADVEMAWFRQYGADQALQRLLLERQRAGEINVIDEGQAWHVCVRPGAGRALRLVPAQQAGR